MKHVKALNNPNLKESMTTGGCGECQSSCQSEYKTEDPTPHQSCERKERSR